MPYLTLKCAAVLIKCQMLFTVKSSKSCKRKGAFERVMGEKLKIAYIRNINGEPQTPKQDKTFQFEKM